MKLYADIQQLFKWVPVGWRGNPLATPRHVFFNPLLAPLSMGNVLVVIGPAKLEAAAWTNFMRWTAIFDIIIPVSGFIQMMITAHRAHMIVVIHDELTFH